MLVIAAIIVCLASQPAQCERHEIRIEHKLCGVSSKAQVPISGEWQDATARIVCSTH